MSVQFEAVRPLSGSFERAVDEKISIEELCAEYDKPTDPTPVSEFVSVGSTLTYAPGILSSFVFSLPLSAGTIVFSSFRIKDRIMALKNEMEGDRRPAVITRIATEILGFTAWLGNGVAFFLPSCVQAIRAIAHGVHSASPAMLPAWKMMGVVAPFFGIVASSIFSILDTIDIVKLVAKRRLINGSIEKLMSKDRDVQQLDLKKVQGLLFKLSLMKSQNTREMKQKLISLGVNLSMLAATIVAVAAAGAFAAFCPYVVIGLSVIAIGLYVYSHRDDITDFVNRHITKTPMTTREIQLFRAVGQAQGLINAA